MATLEEFCKISGTLDFKPVGNVPAGMRIDVAFSGSATSPHWEGERPVEGFDYVTVRADGSMALDIRARLGEGKEVVHYRAGGVGTESGITELLTFETANEDLGWLNTACGIATGSIDGTVLTLTVEIVK